MILLVDFTTDSRRFLEKLIEYLHHRNIPFVIAKDARALRRAQQAHSIHHIILSGSDMFIQDAWQSPRYQQLFQAIARLPKKIPRIGICFGAQYLYTAEGGQIMRMSRMVCTPRRIDSSIPGFHQRALQFCLHETFQDPSPPTCQFIAWARLDGERRPCAIQHTKYPWIGVLFHPENAPTSWDILDHFLMKK